MPSASRNCWRSLIRQEGVPAFPDALRFVKALLDLGWRLAAASSSKNANEMMQSVRLDTGQTLFDVFSANVCGRDLPRGKPDPAIFLLAAAELHVPPEHCFVAEDAPVGIEAALAGEMTALGIARNDDAASLKAAGADVVVTSFDEIAIDALADGRLCPRGQD